MAQFNCKLCTARAFRQVYREAESGQSPPAQQCTEHGDQRVQHPLLCALLGPAERDAAGHNRVSKHLSGDPSLFLHSLTVRRFPWSNENKVCLLAEVSCWRLNTSRESLSRFSSSLSLSVSLCLSFASPPPLLLAVRQSFIHSRSFAVSRISHCPHSFVFWLSFE